MISKAPNATKAKHYSDLPVMDKASDVAAWLDEHKASDVTVLDLQDRSAFTEAMIVATASSVRHAQSLADGVNKLCGEKSYEYLGMDGYNVGRWILVDCNDFVVHIFQEDTRKEYSLESLWSHPAGKQGLQAMAERAAEDMGE